MRWNRGTVRETTWSVLLIAILVLMVVGGVLFYRDYTATSAQSAALDDDGSAYLLFDRPGVTAEVELTAEDDGVLRFRIRADDAGYHLVLTGSARYSGATLGENCPADSVEAGSSVRCRLITPDPATVHPTRDQPSIAQLVSGRVGGDDQPDLVVRTGRPIIQVDGKRRYFGLPAIGTSYVPADERAATVYQLGPRKGYVPARLDLSVDYGDLPVTNRLEVVSPEPLVAGTLYWYEEDASAIKARGSIVDAVAEDDEERTLFLVGLYVGIATAMLPLLVPALWRSVRRLREIAGQDA